MVFKTIYMLGLLNCSIFSYAMEQGHKKDHPSVSTEEHIRERLAELKIEHEKKGIPQQKTSQPRLGSIASLKDYLNTKNAKL